MSNNRGKPKKRLRVRTKRRQEIDNTKLSLALWLVAKGIVENKGDGEDAVDSDESPVDAGKGA